MEGFSLWILAVAVGVGSVSASVVFSNPFVKDLGVPSPPHVTVPIRQMTKYVSYGRPETMHCQATGNPKPTLQWKHNGAPIGTQGDNRLTEFPGNGTLVISSFDSSLEGYYQCWAVSRLGVSLSNLLELRLRVVPVFINEATPGNHVRVMEGDAAKLECTDKPYGRPLGPYHWYHVTQSKGNEQILVHNSDRMEIDLDGNLYIFDAKIEDSADTYACAVSSDDLHSVTIAKTPYVSLEVTSSSAFRKKPSVLGVTGNATSDIGGEVTLECFFKGIPRPRIRWLYGFRNTIIMNGTENRIYISPSSHKLTLKKLRDDDEGRYVCEASNSMGNATAVTFLNVTSRPMFQTTSPQLIVSPVGSDPTFTCVAEGALDEWPLSSPDWTIDGDHVPPNHAKYTLSDDGTQLTVHDVTKKDMMCVQCNVTNSRGYAFGDGYLVVIDPLVVVAQPNSTIDIDPLTEEMVNLTIWATSDQCCPVKFSWSHNGRFLSKTALRTPPFSYLQAHNAATLTLRLSTDMNVDDVVGEYRCDVWHSAYSGNTTVLVTLKEKQRPKPDKDKEKSSGANLWWIGLLGGIIVLLIAIVIIILMIRYNYPRQAYLLDKEEKKHKLNPERDILDHSFEEI